MARFRLATLLQLRTSERDACRSELARAIAARTQLEQQEAELVGQLQQLQNETRASSAPGALNVDKLLSVHRYLLLQRLELQQLRQRAQQVDAEIERRRQRLVVADRELRIVEKLREKHQQQVARHDLSQQQRQIDELAGQRRTGGKAHRGNGGGWR